MIRGWTLLPRRLTAALVCLFLLGCDQAPAPEVTAGIGNLNADGHWQVINYWAIWCHPCRKEIPELNEFATSRHQDTRVYAVNFDGVTGEALLVQANELGIDFILLEEDPAARLGYAPPTVLPTTLIIDPDGNIVARLLGPQTEDSLHAAMTREHRDET